jgi:hypothetical protein
MAYNGQGCGTTLSITGGTYCCPLAPRSSDVAPTVQVVTLRLPALARPRRRPAEWWRPGLPVHPLESDDTSLAEGAVLDSTETQSRGLVLDGAAAEGAYREAIDQLGSTRIRTELARSHLLYGEWLRREHRRVDAREQLRTAHEMFTTMGAEAFAARAERELLATGEQVRKRNLEISSELTAQEAQIARLVASLSASADRSGP